MDYTISVNITVNVNEESLKSLTMLCITLLKIIMLS